MLLEENKAIIRRFVEEVQGQHNLGLAEELMSPDMIDHYLEAQGLPHTKNAVEDFKKFYSGLLAAFPDITAVIHNQVAERDLVATHKTLHAHIEVSLWACSPLEKK
jgi:predicted SnoaL-like aldol condensation-catalyzing enzyme